MPQPIEAHDLELHLVEMAGHWVQQEAPDVVNNRLIAWLKPTTANPRGR